MDPAGLAISWMPCPGQPNAGSLVLSLMDAVSPVNELHAVRALSGDRRTEAVTALFLAHHRRLVGLATLLVDDRETAEDVVQEAFAGLHRRWHLLRDPEAAVTYLNQSVVNRGRDGLRRRLRTSGVLRVLADEPRTTCSAEESALDHDEVDQLRHAVRDLPRRQRQVTVLRYYLGQSEAEIADTLGISRGSVKRHATRALSALGLALEDSP